MSDVLLSSKEAALAEVAVLQSEKTRLGAELKRVQTRERMLAEDLVQKGRECVSLEEDNSKLDEMAAKLREEIDRLHVKAERNTSRPVSTNTVRPPSRELPNISGVSAMA